jgi:hypothetical protein
VVGTRPIYEAAPSPSPSHSSSEVYEDDFDIDLTEAMAASGEELAEVRGRASGHLHCDTVR